MKFGVTPRRACVLNKAGWWRKSARSWRVERWDSKCRHEGGASGYRVELTLRLVHTGTVGRWGGSIPPWTQVRPCGKFLGVVSTPPSRPRYAQKDFTWSWAQGLRDAARGRASDVRMCAVASNGAEGRHVTPRCREGSVGSPPDGMPATVAGGEVRFFSGLLSQGLHARNVGWPEDWPK